MESKKRSKAGKVVTTKKLKLTIPYRHIDADGEVHDGVTEEIKSGDYNFSKIWLKNLETVMNSFRNQQANLFMFILLNMDKRKNLLLMTQDDMIKETGISRTTVTKTINQLTELDMIRHKNGNYIINPDLIYYGRHENRVRAYKDYENYKSTDGAAKVVTDKSLNRKIARSGDKKENNKIASDNPLLLCVIRMIHDGKPISGNQWHVFNDDEIHLIAEEFGVTWKSNKHSGIDRKNAVEAIKKYISEQNQPDKSNPT